MMLPRSVQAQVDAANALQEQSTQANIDNNPAVAAAVPNVESQPVVEPKVELPVQAETKEVSYWRHRFDVLQGKYNSEVPALRKEVTQLEDKLRQAVADGNNQGSAIQRTKSAVGDLTEAEIEEAGPDLVNLIRRVVGKTGAEESSIKEIKQEVDWIKQQRETELKESAGASFISQLYAAVPNLDAVNQNPEFHQWLSVIEPFSGATRQQLLSSAETSQDAGRVIQLFKAFIAESGNKGNGSSIPADMIQPQHSKASVGTDYTNTKVYTNADIAEFYRNKSKMPKDQADAIENDIALATTQGRIRR
jgi:hypothetical protein